MSQHFLDRPQIRPIFQQMGRCIMPHEGVFARVLQGGEIHEDDEIQVLEP